MEIGLSTPSYGTHPGVRGAAGRWPHGHSAPAGIPGQSLCALSAHASAHLCRKKGVVRGTLFPGLDLPFLGMVNEKPLSDTPLHELQTLSFALTELGQYLDTHQEDEEAFQLFRSYAELYRKGKEEYEKMCGPLTLAAAAERESYGWMQDPWPWEYAANCRKEG